MFTLHLYGKLHLLGATGTVSGVLTEPFRWDPPIQEPKTGLNIFYGLKSPYVN